MEDKNIIKLPWQRSESAIEAMSKRFGKRLMWIAMNILGKTGDGSLKDEGQGTVLCRTGDGSVS